MSRTNCSSPVLPRSDAMAAVFTMEQNMFRSIYTKPTSAGSYRGESNILPRGVRLEERSGVRLCVRKRHQHIEFVCVGSVSSTRQKGETYDNSVLFQARLQQDEQFRRRQGSTRSIVRLHPFSQLLLSTLACSVREKGTILGTEYQNSCPRQEPETT